MKSLSRVRLLATPWTVAYQIPRSIEFSRQEYWSGLPFPSPGDLPNQGWNPGLPHCRQTLHHLSHKSTKKVTEQGKLPSQILRTPETQENQRYFWPESISHRLLRRTTASRSKAAKVKINARGPWPPEGDLDPPKGRHPRGRMN